MAAVWRGPVCAPDDAWKRRCQLPSRGRKLSTRRVTSLPRIWRSFNALTREDPWGYKDRSGARDAARFWMRSPNPDLGYEKPLELVAEGQYQRVIDLLLALAEGVTV